MGLLGSGYAEGLGKPVIYTCEKREFEEHSTHFDTNHLHTVPWEESDLGVRQRSPALTIRTNATRRSEVRRLRARLRPACRWSAYLGFTVGATFPSVLREGLGLWADHDLFFLGAGASPTLDSL